MANQMCERLLASAPRLRSVMLASQWVRTLAVLILVAGVASPASAAMISAGAPISIDATTLVVPIEITGGSNVTGWQFDLAYDPLDLQVNSACDPFSDVYCSFLTGPVTEGNFFASGAPFNLLVPGFIGLDPATLTQTGLLFGVNGTFGGFSPFPSGDGTLAFVEFSIVGNGNSIVTVNGSAVSDTTAVPEPGTLALLATGMLLLHVVRRSGRTSDVL